MNKIYGQYICANYGYKIGCNASRQMRSHAVTFVGQNIKQNITQGICKRRD